MSILRTSSLVALLAVCACGGGDSVGPPPPGGGLNPCSDGGTPTVVTLPVGGVRVVSDPAAIGCTELATSDGGAGTFVVVAANAALGARDVILQDPNNDDITTFTGGLEVIP